MSRVAVHVGAAWVRMAVDDPRPRLLAALPVRNAAPTGVLRAGLAALLDRPADELVVVHARGAPPVIPPGTAAAVRVVPAAVAALGAASASADVADLAGAVAVPCDAETSGPAVPGGMPDVVVVDVGHSGTEIARVSRGRVVAASRVAVGGAVLDEATATLLDRSPETRRRGGTGRAGIRAAREALSLHPAVRVGVPPVELTAEAVRRVLAPHLACVVDGVRTVRDGAGSGRSPPVLLVGGVARTPLLAELLDAAGVGDVRVADRPDEAAVVGALRLPSAPRPALPSVLPSALACTVPSAERDNASADRVSVDRVSADRVTADRAPAVNWLPPVPPPRHRRLRLLAAGAVATAVLSGLSAVGAALPPPVPGPLGAAGELVQYGYAVRLPAGWAHTGGLPERRRSLLTPVDAPDGGNLISVERTPLGYDADAEPLRARAELGAAFAGAVADGAPLTGFDDDARFAGRPVVGYRESVRGGGRGTAGVASAPGGEERGSTADAAQVDWYVVLDGDAQLSVGCRHTAAGAVAVAAACETVVGSVRRTA